MIRNLLFVVFLVSILSMNAQSIYNFESENIPYIDLTGCTSLNNGEIWDDPEFTIPIGFNFKVRDFNFSTIYIVEWSGGGELSNKINETGILPIISPIGQDIIDFGFDIGTSKSNISYKTEGISGSQILKIEWNNVGFYDDTTNSDFMNLQLWLYEGSNIIEYRYGINEINNPLESFEGLTGPLVSLITALNTNSGELIDNAFLLEGNPSSPDLVTITPGEFYDGTFLDGAIPAGTVYRLIPQILSTESFAKIEFQIYPNPATDNLYIKTISEISNYSIFNSLGQKTVSAINNNKIDVSNLSSGVYIIKVETSQGSSTQKFVKK